MQYTLSETTPALLLLEWLGRGNRRRSRNSAWRFVQARGSSDPPFRRSVGTLMGDLISSFVMFVTLLVLTWGLGFLFVWLNRYQPFSDEDLKVLSKLKTSMLYFDAILCASASLSTVWNFLKGAIR
jgi:hypothetical protein